MLCPRDFAPVTLFSTTNIFVEVRVRVAGAKSLGQNVLGHCSGAGPREFKSKLSFCLTDEYSIKLTWVLILVEYQDLSVVL